MARQRVDANKAKKKTQNKARANLPTQYQTRTKLPPKGTPKGKATREKGAVPAPPPKGRKKKRKYW